MTHIDNTRELRLKNLRHEAEKAGGISKLADTLDKERSQISQLIGKKPKANIGEGLAREFERKLGLPLYWLDKDHSNTYRVYAEDVNDSPCFIPFVDIDLSHGQETLKMRSGQEKFMLSKSDMDQHGLDINAVCAIKLASDDMFPTMGTGDKVIVDMKKQAIEHGSVYAIKLDGALMVKRLFKDINNAIKITSDNPVKIHFPDLVLPENELSSRLEILGKVVGLNKFGKI